MSKTLPKNFHTNYRDTKRGKNYLHFKYMVLWEDTQNKLDITRVTNEEVIQKVAGENRSFFKALKSN